MRSLVALAATLGVFYLYTAWRLGWQTLQPAPRSPVPRRPGPDRWRRWLVRAGLGAAPVELAVVAGLLGAAGGLAGALVFGGPLPALVCAGLAAAAPVATFRTRLEARQRRAREAWPRLIDEMRILIGAAGRSVPQALLDAGLHAPPELRPAFVAAQREWLLTHDLARTVGVLTDLLADPTADVTCETLVVAHDVGGTDIARRLEALADDRRADVQHRKDAVARQAGARFARRFVLLVPLGMAFAGLSVGSGRSAYQTPTGQLLVLLGLALLVACWWWAGRIMRLPDEQRVFGP